jgi:hypothetical protein
MPVVHRPQHADTSVKQWAAALGGQDQRLYGCLPVWQLLLSLG